jgi:hypothetical protein
MHDLRTGEIIFSNVTVPESGKGCGSGRNLAPAVLPVKG